MGAWVVTNRKTHYAKQDEVGYIVDSDSRRIEFYVPKEVTTEPEMTVFINLAKNGIMAINILKVSDVVVPQNIPAFMLDQNGGPFSTESRILPLQRYVSDTAVPFNAERPINGYLKLRYSIALNPD